MSYSRNKLKLVVMLLLIFVGQVSASSAFSVCHMNMQNTNSQSDDASPQGDMSEMAHSAHIMSSIMNESETNMDCCDKGGGCSMTSCLSLALFSIFESNTLVFSTTPNILDANMSIARTPSSLYRPPIAS